MAWNTVTSLAGATGPQGPTGATGPQGVEGPAGPAGADGAGIEIAGGVPTYADLPTGLTEVNSGEGYLVEADGKLYIWNGTSFPADGAGVEFRGPEGPAGATGPQGVQGPAGEQGVAGADGATGAAGADGAQGDRGNTWFTGVGAPTTIPGSIVGDLYLDTDTSNVYKLS